MTSLPKASKLLTITGALAAGGTTLSFPHNSLSFIPNKAIIKTMSYRYDNAAATAMTTYEVSSNLTNGTMFCFVPSMTFVNMVADHFYLFASLTPNIELDLRNGAANALSITVRDLEGMNAAGFVSFTIEFLQLGG